jgi:hypothetical protein
MMMPYFFAASLALCTVEVTGEIYLTAGEEIGLLS